MNNGIIEHLESVEIKEQQLTAIATVTGEAAEKVEHGTLALCFQVIERLGRECLLHIEQTE